MKSKPLAIIQLTSDDLQELAIMADRADGEPEFWKIIKQFSVTERLNRKSYNTHSLDFSELNTDVIEEALITSLACEKAYLNNDRERMARFFRFLTLKIEQCIYAMN